MEGTQAQTVSPGPSITRLFGSFLRLGITAFGGPAMIAFMRKMAVTQRHWIDPESFQSGVALCQTIPGATVMQMAAYIGLRIRGVRGALASYIGFCTACVPAHDGAFRSLHVYRLPAGSRFGVQRPAGR